MKIATCNVNGVNGPLPRLPEWFERLDRRARTPIGSGRPAVPAGDFTVVPTNAGIGNAWLWREDAALQPQTGATNRAIARRCGSSCV